MSDWDESKHPRVPGGKTKGGQFASKSSGGGFPFKGKKQVWGTDYEVHQSDELDDVNKEMFLNHFEWAAKGFLADAQELERDYGGPPVVYIFKDGEPYAFYQGGISEVLDDGSERSGLSGILGKSPYKVEFLGSAGPGGGTTALAEAICEAAVTNATSFFLTSAGPAVGFYEKIGMHRENDWSTLFYYTKEELDLIFNEMRKGQ